jgi:multiple sugar transport system substrate-binding protein
LAIYIKSHLIKKKEETMKRINFFLCIVLFVFITAFCLYAEGGKEPGEVEKKYPFSGETITIACHGEPKSAAIYMIEEDFFEKYGVKLNVVEIAPEALYEKEMIELSAGGSAYDVVQFNAFSIADYSPHLTPLEPLAEKWGLDFHLDDVLPSFQQLYLSWGGTWYGVCSDGDVHMFYYRADLFEDPENKRKFKAKYGYDLAPPKTWEQYLDAAEFFTGWDWDNDGEKEYGTAEYLKRGRMYWWFSDRFVTYGGNYFDDDMNPLINTEPGIKAVENMIAAIPFQPPGALNYSYMEVRTALVKGDVAMGKQWTCVGRAGEDPNESKVLNKLAYTTVPGKISILAGGYTMSIPKYSKHKDAALHFLHYFADVETGLPIVVKNTTVDPYRYSQFEAIDEFRQEYPNWKRVDEYLDAIVTALEKGFPDLTIPGAAEYNDVLDYELCQAIAGKKSPRRALDDAAAAWEKITDRLGRESQKQYWHAELAAMKKLGGF